jgi:hypothetical protein
MQPGRNIALRSSKVDAHGAAVPSGADAGFACLVEKLSAWISSPAVVMAMVSLTNMAYAWAGAAAAPVVAAARPGGEPFHSLVTSSY